MTDPWGVIGIIFAQLVVWPQLFKVIKTKQVKDVAVWTYIFLVVAVLLYTIHAVIIGDLIFMITNGLSFLTNSVLLFLIIKYKKS